MFALDIEVQPGCQRFSCVHWTQYGGLEFSVQGVKLLLRKTVENSKFQRSGTPQ